jgi:hypothetical protein
LVNGDLCHFASSVFLAIATTWSPSLSVVIRWQGTFRNRWGNFNESWCEDTFGQYGQRFFDFRDLTYFVAYMRPS